MSDRLLVRLAVHVALIKNHQVLLLKRKNTGYRDGNFGLPSGHVEPGETTREAAARELEEETSVKVSPEELAFFHIIYRRSARYPYIDFFFFTTDWSGEVFNAEPTKCSEFAWCNLTQLPENILSETKIGLESLFSETVFSDIERL